MATASPSRLEGHRSAASQARPRRRTTAALLFLGGVLVLSMVVGAAVGAVAISPVAVLQMLVNKLGLLHLSASWPASHETIFFQIRLPRVLGGALVGAALATAGVVFQGLLRNPMADPYIIGTSAGAALGATVALMLPVSVGVLGLGVVPVAAFVGAVTTVAIVYRLARVGSRTPIISLLLAGFAVSSLLVAVMMFLLTMSDRLQLKLRQTFAFLMGGVSVTNWQQLLLALALVTAGVLLARALALHLNAFALGEEGAASLGVDVERDKVILLALGALLTALAVSLSGLIGFVGLVVPHAVRLTVGPDHRVVIPTAALSGAAFLVIADLVSRVVLAPSEVPVGIITALVGGPFFIYLLRRGRREYAF